MKKLFLLAALTALAAIPCKAGTYTDNLWPDNYAETCEFAAPDADTHAREMLWSQFRRIPSDKRPRIGLVLAGGGARGFAHVGLIQIMRYNDFPVDLIAGTSMGAVVGSLFASGIAMEDLWDIGRNASLKYATNDMNTIGIIRLVTAQRLFSSRRMEDFINTHIGHVDFNQLRIPFACVAMDIRTGEKIVFEDGDVGLAVRASMNIPGMFEPVRYRQYELVDGGVIDNVPVDVAKKMGADWVFTSLIQGDLSKTSFNSVYAYLMQVMDVRGSILLEEQLKGSNFILRSPVSHINFIAFEKAYTAGRIGLEESYKRIDEAKDSVMLYSMDSIYAGYKNEH